MTQTGILWIIVLSGIFLLGYLAGRFMHLTKKAAPVCSECDLALDNGHCTNPFCESGPRHIAIKEGDLSLVSIRCLFCESDQLQIIGDGDRNTDNEDWLTLPTYQCVTCFARCVVQSNESLLWQLPIDIDLFPPTYGAATPETMDDALTRTLKCSTNP